MRLPYFFILVAILFPPLAWANTFYRHIPFHVTTHTADTISINYDFSGKLGIYCNSTVPGSTINFTYKGRHKSASLPILLQSDHVPNQENEVLADTNGRFTLRNPKKMSFASSKFTCRYATINAAS